MPQTNFNPAAPLYANALQHPDNTALWVDGATYSYGELAKQASQVADWLLQKTGGTVKRVAILSSRSISAYAGIIGACWAGAGYVPLNPAFPEKRLLKIINLAQPDVLIVDAASISLLYPAILNSFPDSILLINSESATVHGTMLHSLDRFPSQTNLHAPVEVGPDCLAYLMFTSGTTGQPNGVPITAGNLAFAVQTFIAHYKFTPDDRFSQYFDLSFDFSVMDLFVSWKVGASTHVVPAAQKLAPGRFIIDQELTVWTCVPSMIAYMGEMRMLNPGIFPSLRFSCFSGAPLTAKSAQTWQESAPNSIVVNLYGQTEAPIGSLAQTYNSSTPLTTGIKGVPLGKPFEGVYAAILGENENFAKPNLSGELALSGTHIANGYLNNPDRTAAKFKVIEHPDYGLRTWYLTGDHVRQDPEGTFHFLGRTDHEVKISGHRIMLEEVEHYLHETTGYGEVATIVWNNHLELPEALIAFVVGENLEEPAVKKSMAQNLPRPFIPRRIFAIEKLPLNHNGKIDRKALAEIAYKKMDQDN